MKNLEALKQKHKELGEEIEKLEAAKNWPSDGDRYWFIDSGSIDYFTWDNESIDKYCLQTRNIFRTLENAELWLKIHNRVHELIGDWKADWGGKAHHNYFISWDYEDVKPTLWCSIVEQNKGTTYMPKHAAITLIEEFGDDLKIWICGEEI